MDWLPTYGSLSLGLRVLVQAYMWDVPAVRRVCRLIIIGGNSYTAHQVATLFWRCGRPLYQTQRGSKTRLRVPPWCHACHIALPPIASLHHTTTEWMN